MERNSEEYRKYLQECKGPKIPYLGNLLIIYAVINIT